MYSGKVFKVLLVDIKSIFYLLINNVTYFILPYIFFLEVYENCSHKNSNIDVYFEVLILLYQSLAVLHR